MSVTTQPQHTQLMQMFIDAVKSGCLPMVTLLVEQGININFVVDDCGYTPLHLALSLERHDVSRFLIARGAKVNAQTTQGITPLHICALKNYDGSLVQDLLTKGANPYLRISDTFCNIDGIASGNTVLHTACSAGNFSVVKILLATENVNINDINHDFHTPLLLAHIFKQHSLDHYIADSIISALLVYGASSITQKPSLFFPRMTLSSYSMADRLIIMYHCSSEQLSLYACGNKLASYIKFRVAFIHVLDKVFHNWQHVNTTVNDKYCALSKEQFLHSAEYVSSIRSAIADYGLDIFYKSFNSAVSCIFHLENNSIYNTYTQTPIVASCNTTKVCSV